METTKQTVEIDIPKGWKFVGFRKVKAQEYYMRFDPNRPEKWPGSEVSSGMYVVVEKVPVYRKVTLDDLAKVIAGQTVRVRFSDPGVTPVMGSLGGIAVGNLGQVFYLSTTRTSWAFAEIEVTDDAH